MKSDISRGWNRPIGVFGQGRISGDALRRTCHVRRVGRHWQLCHALVSRRNINTADSGSVVRLSPALHQLREHGRHNRRTAADSVDRRTMAFSVPRQRFPVRHRSVFLAVHTPDTAISLHRKTKPSFNKSMLLPLFSTLTITGSTFVLLGVVWKVNGRPSTSTPRGTKTSGGSS